MVDLLKRAWTALYFTDNNDLWRDINEELARLLPMNEYRTFVNDTEKKLYIGDTAL